MAPLPKAHGVSASRGGGGWKGRPQAQGCPPTPPVLGSTEPPHHQLTRAPTPRDPQARGVHPPAPKTQHGRPGSRRASCRHAATRGRPARGAAPSCRSRSGVRGRPLPREVTLLPSPHVALALLSVPGPCGEFTGGGVQPQDPRELGRRSHRESRQGGPARVEPGAPAGTTLPSCKAPITRTAARFARPGPEAPAPCSPRRRRQPGRQPTSPSQACPPHSQPLAAAQTLPLCLSLTGTEACGCD